jgi:hypothetical protein
MVKCVVCRFGNVFVVVLRGEEKRGLKGRMPMAYQICHASDAEDESEVEERLR